MSEPTHEEEMAAFYRCQEGGLRVVGEMVAKRKPRVRRPDATEGEPQ